MVYSRAMQDVLHGVARFEKDIYPKKQRLFQSLAYEQKPEILFITCSDSRVAPELITQMDPGELFVMRNIGNIVPADGYAGDNVAAVLEYAIKDLKVRDIILCGHSNCGAMKALAKIKSEPREFEKIEAIHRWLGNAEKAHETTSVQRREDAFQDMAVLSKANIRLQLHHLETYPFIKDAMNERSLQIHGWYYDIKGGEIRVLDRKHHRDFSVQEALSIAAGTNAR